MVKKIVLILSILFVIIGILGFVPGVTHDGELFWLFHVNLIHNILHLICGVLGLAMVLRGEREAMIFAWGFAGVYALLAVLSFILRGDLIILQFNSAMTWLSLVLALVFAAVGFLGLPKRTATV